MTGTAGTVEVVATVASRDPVSCFAFGLAEMGGRRAVVRVVGDEVVVGARVVVTRSVVADRERPGCEPLVCP